MLGGEEDDDDSSSSSSVRLPRGSFGWFIDEDEEEGMVGKEVRTCFLVFSSLVAEEGAKIVFSIFNDFDR